MNFKNISLFSLLFVTGFTITVAHAKDEFKVKMDLQKKLEFKRRELAVLLASREIQQDLLSECSGIVNSPEGTRIWDRDIEACAYWQQQITDDSSLDIGARMYLLQDEIKGIENEISDKSFQDNLPFDESK